MCHNNNRFSICIINNIPSLNLNLPLFHNRDTVTKVFHCIDVVRNKNDGQPQAFAQFAEKREYLHTDRNVQRADGFIGDEDF